MTEEGYTTPTPIQAQAIPPALEGRDLLGCAQTGTGKTAAFALPILHRLMATPSAAAPSGGAPPRAGRVPPRALILAPTRELANQIGASFATYGRRANLRHAVIFGGVSEFHQIKAIERGIDVLVATPGRLIDLFDRRLVDLSAVGVFVLDEADRMLDMGFIRPIRKIAGALPKARQTMLFSATMPREIRALAASLLVRPVEIAVTPVASPAPRIEQSVYFVTRAAKQSLLEHLLRGKDVERSLVFTRTKHGADRVTRRLNRIGVRADAIHGNKAQNRRDRALTEFRQGKIGVLVATDVASRGLDIDGVTHVFNFDLPHEPEAYVHRIGRTGRAGATGLAIAFCDSEERPLLRDIERLTGRTVPVLPLPQDLVVEPMERERTPAAPIGREGPRPQQHRGERAARGGKSAARKPHRGEHARRSSTESAAPRASIGSGAGEQSEQGGKPAGFRSYSAAGRGRGRARGR